MMFEVGKKYEVEIIEQGGERSFVRGEALAVEGTLLKLQVDNRERVFNTSASVVVGVTEWRVPTSSVYQPMKEPKG